MTDGALDEVVQRSKARPALLSSLGVLGFLLAQNLAYLLIRAAQAARYDLGEFGFGFASTWVTIGMSLGLAVFFALGMFVCLWLLAPVTGELRLGQVARRAILAATIGAACVWVFRFFAEFIHVATTPELRGQPDVLGGVVFDTLMDSLGTLVGLLPLVVLAVLALWGWLRWGAQAPAAAVATLKS